MLHERKHTASASTRKSGLHNLLCSYTCKTGSGARQSQGTDDTVTSRYTYRPHQQRPCVVAPSQVSPVSRVTDPRADHLGKLHRETMRKAVDASGSTARQARQGPWQGIRVQLRARHALRCLGLAARPHVSLPAPPHSISTDPGTSRGAASAARPSCWLCTAASPP